LPVSVMAAMFCAEYPQQQGAREQAVESKSEQSGSD